MLLEVAAYGLAIRKVWPNLKEHWAEALSWFGGSPSRFPAHLDNLTLICAAPPEYWCRCLGLRPQKNGKFPVIAWLPFWKLVAALATKGLEVQFVVLGGSCDKSAQQATITHARVLELRSLTLDPSADRAALMEACQRTVHHSPSFR